jgi:hypothetical protein
MNGPFHTEDAESAEDCGVAVASAAFGSNERTRRAIDVRRRYGCSVALGVKKRVLMRSVLTKERTAPIACDVR